VRRHRFVSVDEHGVATWGERVLLHDRPAASPHTVQALDAHGAIVATVTGEYWSYDHVGAASSSCPSRRAESPR
jgi:hypothetical protein